MVLDYKGVSFSFKTRKREKFLRKVKVIAFIIAVVFFYFMLRIYLDSGKVADVCELLLQDKTAEAATAFESFKDSAFHRSSKQELKALVNLFEGDLPRATKVLASLTAGSTSIDYQVFLDYFSRQAKYRELKIYSDYLHRRGEPLPFFRALSSTALFDHKNSSVIIGTLTPVERELHKKEWAIIETVNKELQTGRINYIFDVNGIPMAYYDLAKKETVSLTPGMTFEAFNKGIRECIAFYSLTIDISIQKKLHRSFKKQHGSFLMFNLDDSGIIAAYSRPFDNSVPGNAVFYDTYEPGSIIKILTLFSYLQLPEANFFPYDCKGSSPIAGKTFYDWFRHRNIESYEEALAVSCNISFAKMGIKLGSQKLAAVFEDFFFNNGGITDLFLEFKTGKCNKNIANNYQLANLSVGLNEISITTFHAALISATLSLNGSIYSPHLIKNKKNLLDLAFYNHSAELLSVSNDNAGFLKVKNAMLQVVEDKRGTGRRSKVDFMQVGLKTGTAGSKKIGLDAVLTGFFPFKKPKYAFAFRLERAGKAELKGAYFLKGFLNSLYNQE
ncbi:MAG: hypothetical protein GY757_16055 [bacterium]|nr:hypothetical protein [bacterium]